MTRAAKLKLIELIKNYCKTTENFIFCSDMDGLIYRAIYNKGMTSFMGYTGTKNARIISNATSEQKKEIAQIRAYLEEKNIINRTSTGKYIVADAVLNY